MEGFLQNTIGLQQDEVDTLRSGRPLAMSLPSSSPSQVYLFGAIYIKASPESYMTYAQDYERIRRMSNYISLGLFSRTPRLSDLNGFVLDKDEVEEIRRCEPGDCLIQAPVGSIQSMQSINWSASDADRQVTAMARSNILRFLEDYQREGNRALGVYHDKSTPTVVNESLDSLLSYKQAMPQYLPELYLYLKNYPQHTVAGVEDTFYWAKVKFGLKPTVRLVHVVAMQGDAKTDVACAIAEKQLYATHYFRSALDLSLCLRDHSASGTQGFYLLMLMGSDQAGLTGFRGSILKKVAVQRSVDNLRKALLSIQSTLEHH